MEIVLGLVCFVLIFRLLGSFIKLPVGWTLIGALIATLVVYPTIAFLLQASAAAFVGTEVCMPLLYPLLILVAAILGFLFGTRSPAGSRQPIDPF